MHTEASLLAGLLTPRLTKTSIAMVHRLRGLFSIATMFIEVLIGLRSL